MAGSTPEGNKHYPQNRFGGLRKDNARNLHSDDYASLQPRC